MRYCTKCGSQMTDDVVFCRECGAKDEFPEDVEETKISVQQNMDNTSNDSGDNVTRNPKLRTSMKIWMIISFVYAGLFAIGSIIDISMFAGVCLFGVLGAMFLILAKTPKGSVKLFTENEFFKETQGLSKGAFVGISVFLAMFLFVGAITIFDTSNEAINEVEVNQIEKAEEQKQVSEPVIPEEFSQECPITVAVSMYDNIIGFPELSCNIKNKTDMNISAIQLYFIPKDVYGEEADGFFAQNRLQHDTPIEAYGSDTVVWQMIDQSVKSGDLYVYSVYFSDGTEWGDRNASLSKIKKYALKMTVSY